VASSKCLRYQHTSFGLLVQEACKLANTNLSAAWKSFADEVPAGVDGRRASMLYL